MRGSGYRDGCAPWGWTVGLPAPARAFLSRDARCTPIRFGVQVWPTSGWRGDWYTGQVSGTGTRKVLSRRISNTINAGFGVDCLEEAIRLNGKPEVFNSAQRSRFGSEAFTGGFETGRDQDQHGRKRTGARQYMGGMA